MSSEPVLRRASAIDGPFMLSVFAASRDEEFAMMPPDPAMRETFLTQQWRALAAARRVNYPAAEQLVIQVDGVPVGSATFDRSTDVWRVVDIALLTEHRGQGTGTAVLRRLQGEAFAAGASVDLRVMAWSSARRLYERLGFVASEGGDGVRVHMTWSPPITRT